MKRDFSQRFGFLVNDVAKLYGEQFDRLARERIGLSRAQCRVLGALAMHGDEAPMSQVELAQRLDLSAMAVGSLCDRLEAAGWLHRQDSPSDRRVRLVRAAASAEQALDTALGLSDGLQARALAQFTPAERTQLVALLARAREGLLSLQAEVTAERWTSLDRSLRWEADRAGGVVDLRPGSARPEATRQLLAGRAAHLERMGLAEPVGPGRWRLEDSAQGRLRDLSIRGDIIKTLHRAMARDGGSVDPARFTLHDEASAAPVIGRLVERGLNDELVGTAYAVVDGVDGRQHHVPFKDLADTGDAKPGAIVELRVFVGERGQAVRQLATRSDLDLAGQVKAQGATWLDRQLVHRSGFAGHGGFAQEVQAAMAQRGDVLVERGLARRFGDRLVLSPGALETLKARDLDAARSRLAAETGLAPKAAATGDTVAGVYRRRIDLASGRFAMIDDGLGFQLVPWRSRLDDSLGRAVAGVVLPSGEIQWGRSRSRGLGL